MQSLALQIVGEDGCRAAAQSRHAQAGAFQILDPLVRFAPDENIRRGVVDSGDDLQIRAFLVDQDHTVCVERAEIDLAGDQCLKLHVAPADENQFGLQILRGVEASFETDVKRQVEKRLDRKSTRLNSSHLVISYAVFCSKKKNKQKS